MVEGQLPDPQRMGTSSRLLRLRGDNLPPLSSFVVLELLRRGYLGLTTNLDRARKEVRTAPATPPTFRLVAKVITTVGPVEWDLLPMVTH